MSFKAHSTRTTVQDNDASHWSSNLALCQGMAFNSIFLPIRYPTSSFSPFATCWRRTADGQSGRHIAYPDERTFFLHHFERFAELHALTVLGSRSQWRGLKSARYSTPGAEWGSYRESTWECRRPPKRKQHWRQSEGLCEAAGSRGANDDPWRIVGGRFRDVLLQCSKWNSLGPL